LIDNAAPNVARIYDYLLGGKDNRAVDREAAEKICAVAPETRRLVQENRYFLARVVQFLAGEAGITQFLDIGTGFPTQENVHEVAQRINPAARTVYVDFDPVVLSHARALLATTSDTSVVDADLRQPAKVLEEAAGFLDFSRPVAVLLIAIVHFLSDEDGAHKIVRTLVDGLPPGSYVAMSHVEHRPRLVEAARYYTPSNGKVVFRTREQFASLFDGLELVEPGLVHVDEWRPELAPVGFDTSPVWVYGAVGRKQ
jgi:hypothetical protein